MKRVINYIFNISTLAIVSAILMLTACEQSYPGIEYEKEDNNITNDEASHSTPIQLFVDEPSLFSITATRGTGSVDKGEDDWNERRKNMKLQVFAFNKDGADMRETMAARHGEDAPDYKYCLIDNEETSGSKYYIGRNTRLIDDEGLEFISNEETNQTEQLYYSSKHQEQGYNFFAYYIDDFVPNSSNTYRNRDEIYHNIDIDGSQDIMCGYAPQPTYYSVLHALNYTGFEKAPAANETDRARQEQDAAYFINNMLTPTEKTDVSNILNYGFSTYSAHRGVNPIIKVKHMLTRLKFEAYPGDESAKDIIITDIVIKSRTKAKLTVAANDLTKIGLTFDQSEPQRELYLREKPANGFGPTVELNTEYRVDIQEDERGLLWHQRTPTPIGDCMLVEPAEELELILFYKENRPDSSVDGNDNWIPNRLKYRIIPSKDGGDSYDKESNTYRFKAGYSYVVKIAVYGMQPIEVSASIEGWKVGGDIIIDPDDPDNSDILM